MKTKLLIGAVALVAIGVFAVALLQQPPAAAPSPTSTSNDQTLDEGIGEPPQAAGSSATTSSYTMAMVAAHNSAASCWAAINGNVYDLTKWIPQHPGGPQRILNLCGTDGSAMFNAQHGGDARPHEELATFLLGPLSQ